MKLQETISINGFVSGKCGPQKIIKTYSIFFKKQKELFKNVCANEVETLKNVKTQFIHVSRDVLEMFYGPIEENQRLITPISPSISGGFEIARNNFKQWLRV